jgi:hypothetical protein
VINPNETVCDGAGDRYDVGAQDLVFGGWDALKDNETQDGDVALSNCKSYDFSHECAACVDPSLFADQVQSLNEFKRIKGVYGSLMTSNNGEGVGGSTVDLYRVSTGELVQSGVSDEDGFYALNYKHTGPEELYDVIPQGTGLIQQASLKANSWAEVNCDVFTGSCSAVVNLQGNAKVAAFDASPTSGTKPLVVDFTDSSYGNGISTWSWDFGDNTTSTEQHPTHTYLDAGVYTVSLTVSGDGPSDTYVAPNLIAVTSPPSSVGGSCGLGIELALLLPLLMGLRRRREGRPVRS